MLSLSRLDIRKLHHIFESEEGYQGAKTDFDGGTNTTQGREDVQSVIVGVVESLECEVQVKTDINFIFFTRFEAFFVFLSFDWITHRFVAENVGDVVLVAD